MRQTRVKTFVSGGQIIEAESKMNEWLSKNNVRVLHMTQSESQSCNNGYHYTRFAISILYRERIK